MHPITIHQIYPIYLKHPMDPTLSIHHSVQPINLTIPITKLIPSLLLQSANVPNSWNSCKFPISPPKNAECWSAFKKSGELHPISQKCHIAPKTSKRYINWKNRSQSFSFSHSPLKNCWLELICRQLFAWTTEMWLLGCLFKTLERFCKWW